MAHIGLFGAMSASAAVAPPRAHEDIEIVVIAPEPEPEPVQVEPEPEPEPIVEPEPQPEPIVEPEPDPVEAEPEPEPEPARRVVGLSMDSMAEGGDGPRYAVGNTRMGRTEGTAANPTEVGKRPPANAAAEIPVGKGKLRKPRRLGTVELVYPPDLEAQGIEADVPVEVDIDAKGAVLAVRIIREPSHAAFATSAAEAARKQRFKPALVDGRGVAYTLSYTYRFRITS